MASPAKGDGLEADSAMPSLDRVEYSKRIDFDCPWLGHRHLSSERIGDECELRDEPGVQRVNVLASIFDHMSRRRLARFASKVAPRFS